MAPPQPGLAQPPPRLKTPPAPSRRLSQGNSAGERKRARRAIPGAPHHDAVWQGDGVVVHQVALLVGQGIPAVRGARHLVAKEEQLPGLWVHLGHQGGGWERFLGGGEGRSALNIHTVGGFVLGGLPEVSGSSAGARGQLAPLAQ